MKRTGKIHAARIKDSKRHQIILQLLKDAWHPLSSQDIAKTAYPNSDDIMLNVSTNLGEMRSQDNQMDGFIVSHSTIWRVGTPDQIGTKRENKDGSTTFFIEKLVYPWHDGRPRYFLISAPGWSPRWRVTEKGEIQACMERDGRVKGQVASSQENQNQDRGKGQVAGSQEGQNLAPCPLTLDPSIQSTGPGTPCRLPRCGRPIPEGKKDTSKFCCDAHRDEYHKNIHELGKQTAKALQGSLFK